MNYIVLIMLILIGIYDLYLVVKKHPTLSQQYQKLLPTWIDMVIFVCCLFALINGLPWVDWRLKVAIMGIIGHVVWPNKERYEK